MQTDLAGVAGHMRMQVHGVDKQRRLAEPEGEREQQVTEITHGERHSLGTQNLNENAPNHQPDGDKD